MFEAIGQGLTNVLSPIMMLWIIGGVIIGMVVGILPGIGGSAALAILLPLCYKLNPTVAITFLISLHATVYQGGAITSILFGIPGETTTTATIFDGYAMAKKGMAGRALAISQTASMLGGLFGGVVLATLIPVAKKIVLSFAAPELCMVAIMGLSFVAVLGRGNPIKSLICAVIGLMFAYVGYHDITGTMRYTGGFLYFWEGVKIVPLFMGLFALPEVIDLAVGGGTIAEKGDFSVQWGHVWLGIKDAFRHWWLVIRCSAIGTYIGIVPGVGAVVSQFLCYAHAKQTSKHPEEFGKGCAEGIVAPQSGDNAKEGGALLTTLSFGLPGSSGMVFILAALMILGIKPGPDMLATRLDLIWTIVITLIVANVVASLMGLTFAKQLAKLTFVKANILIPVITLFVILGAYGTSGDIRDVALAFIFGFIGYFMKMYGYNRVTLTIACVLGDYVERYFIYSYSSLGPDFILRSPIALILVFLTILGLVGDKIKNLILRAFRPRAI